MGCSSPVARGWCRFQTRGFWQTGVETILRPRGTALPEACPFYPSVDRARLSEKLWRSAVPRRPIGGTGVGASRPLRGRPPSPPTNAKNRPRLAKCHNTPNPKESTTYRLSDPEDLSPWFRMEVEKGVVRLGGKIFSGNPLQSARIRYVAPIVECAVTGSCTFVSGTLCFSRPANLGCIQHRRRELPLNWRELSLSV